MEPQAGRVETLDYMRGVMSLSIMLYHFLAWSSIRFDADSIIGRIGVYGVSIFYIVSGISLYLAYSRITLNKSGLGSFYKKRLLRIAPLYLLACALVLMSNYSINGNLGADFQKIALNFTLSFSVLSPSSYIPAGGWSIGNEVFFYLAFPALIFCSRSRLLLPIAFGAILWLYIDFSWIRLSASEALAQQWKVYINPLNQIWLFAAGILIGMTRNGFQPSKPVCLLVGVISIAVIWLLPASGNAINIVTGENRLYLTAACLALCYSALHIGLTGSTMLEKPFKFLGEISYSVYLLHGVTFTLMQMHIFRPHLKGMNIASAEFALYFIAPTVIALAWVTHKYFEQPFIKLGHKK